MATSTILLNKRTPVALSTTTVNLSDLTTAVDIQLSQSDSSFNIIFLQFSTSSINSSSVRCQLFIPVSNLGASCYYPLAIGENFGSIRITTVPGDTTKIRVLAKSSNFPTLYCHSVTGIV